MTSVYDPYFRHRKTVVQMLKDRGYDVVQEEILSSIDHFRSHFRQEPDSTDLGFRVSHRSDPSDTLQVVFAKLGDLKVDDLRNIYNVKIQDKASLKRLILIVFGKLAKNAKKEIEGWKFECEILPVKDLNIFTSMNDFKSNQFHVVPNDQKAALLSQYKSEGKELSRMQATDHIACYYGMKKGQVITATNRDGFSHSLIV